MIAVYLIHRIYIYFLNRKSGTLKFGMNEMNPTTVQWNRMNRLLRWAHETLKEFQLVGFATMAIQ